MFTVRGSTRRWIGRFLLLLLAPHLLGCTATSHIAPPAPVDSLRVTGVTLRSGQHIRFAKPGLTMTHDTLWAAGEHGRIAIAADSIKTIDVTHSSTGRTIALVAVIAVGVLVIVAAASYEPVHWQGPVPARVPGGAHPPSAGTP